ncbi:hypothetical protein KUTeg_011815, partial [Tegillarca granosa]
INSTDDCLSSDDNSEVYDSYDSTDDTCFSDSDNSDDSICSFDKNVAKSIKITFQQFFPECPSLQEFSYENMWKLLDEDMSNEFKTCNKVFPSDRDIFTCTADGCCGLRYKGINQLNKSRQPRASFVIANLQNLLKSQGIWDDIKKNKQVILERHNQKPGTITDITDGIWQGKGKPPFKQYLQAFSSVINEIYETGITFVLDSEEVVVKLAVLCGTVDLPAKAGVLNMTYFNGAESCITCEEPGKVVKQGKGHSRCFPYRT